MQFHLNSGPTSAVKPRRGLGGDAAGLRKSSRGYKGRTREIHRRYNGDISEQHARITLPSRYHHATITLPSRSPHARPTLAPPYPLAHHAPLQPSAIRVLLNAPPNLLALAPGHR